MTTAMTLASYFCGVVIFGSFIWIGVALHIAQKKMDCLLELLKNCSAVSDHAFVKNIGPWGKLLMIGGISGLVTFPGIHLKYGRASISDLENLPISLKRKLVILHLCGLGLSVGFVLAAGMVEVFDRYNI